MAPTFSPLLAALDASGSSIKWEHLNQVVAERLAESSQLDWKIDPPSDMSEFAKDVAAFANAEGGQIVYGVGEVSDGKGLATASILKLHEYDDKGIRKLNQAIISRIQPPVVGVNIETVLKPGEDTGILVVTVPRSNDAPHLVFSEQHLFSVPMRSGTDTRYLREFEIERGYTRRFASDEDARTALAKADSELMVGIDLEDPWLTAVARPLGALRSGRVSQAELRQTFDAAIRAAIRLTENSEGHTELSSLGSGANSSRVGFRRRTVSDTDGRGNNLPPAFMRAHLHDDGTAGLASAVRGNVLGAEIDPNVSVLDELAVNTFARDAVALIAAHAATSGLSGRYHLRANLHLPQSAARSMMAELDITREGRVRGHTRYQSPSVFDFVPFELTIETSTDEELHDAAKSLARDILTQYGFARLVGHIGGTTRIE